MVREFLSLVQEIEREIHKQRRTERKYMETYTYIYIYIYKCVCKNKEGQKEDMYIKVCMQVG